MTYKIISNEEADRLMEEAALFAAEPHTWESAGVIQPDLYETIGRTDAIYDEQSAAERTVAGGRCTLCEEDVPELLPWSGQRLCWDCVDLNLDLLAKAVLETTPVRIGQGSLVRDDQFPEIMFTMEPSR